MAVRSTLLRGGAVLTTVVMLMVIATLPLAAAAAIDDGKQRRSDDVNSMAAVVEKLSQDLLGLQSQLTAQHNQLESQIQALQTQLEAERQKVAALEAVNSLTVAFSAYIATPPSSVQASAGSTIPFQRVITNVGDAYNPATSAFTAPRPGQYFFIVHADCSPDYRGMFVNLNGRHVFAAHNDGGEDHHVTGSGLVTLQAGDVVTTSHYTSVGAVDAGYESTFTGFWVK